MDKIETVWKMRECSMQEVKELAYELEIPIPVAQVMLTRGIDSVLKAEQFLDKKKEHNQNADGKKTDLCQFPYICDSLL